MLSLTIHHLQTLQRHAEALYPEECCGLLLGTHQPVLEPSKLEPIKVVRHIYATPNRWEHRPRAERSATLSAEGTVQERYWIDPEDMLIAQQYARRCGWDIIGIYHSHPNAPAVPSVWDQAWAWPEYSYVILSLKTGSSHKLQSWILDPHHEFLPEKLVILDETPPQVEPSLEGANLS